MRTVIDYKIEVAKGEITLEKLVKHWLNEGWQPLGGVSNDGNEWICQALVLYKQEPKEEDLPALDKMWDEPSYPNPKGITTNLDKVMGTEWTT